MRIYAVADIHARAERFALIRHHISRLRPQVLLVAGDVTSYLRPLAVIRELDDLGLPVLAVRGNSDLLHVDRLLARFPRTASLHLRKVHLDGFGFVGVSGTIPVPFRSRVGLADGRLMARLAPLLTPSSVLVAHPPPWGARDVAFGRFHAGSRALRALVERFQPALLVCGHIHEDAGTAPIGRTLVVNCSLARSSAGALIELEPDRPPRVTMLDHPSEATAAGSVASH